MDQNLIGIGVCVYIILGFANLALQSYLFARHDGQDIDDVNAVTSILFWPLLFVAIPYVFTKWLFSGLGRRVRAKKLADAPAEKKEKSWRDHGGGSVM